jgi:hypothetical protein
MLTIAVPRIFQETLAQRAASGFRPANELYYGV